MTELINQDRSDVSIPHWSTRDLITAALLHRVLIARICLGVTCLVGAYTLVSPKQFTSRATIATPPAGLMTPALGGIAAQLGLGVGLSGASRPPAFYADLARSSATLQTLVQGEYAFEDSDTLCKCDLVTYFDEGTSPKGLGVERAAEKLQDRVSTTIYQEAGTIELAVTLEDPKLAQAVASRLLDELDLFNIRERSERASAERQFLQTRLDSAGAAQREAEDDLERFLAANRELRGSPMLQVQYDRLEREARLRQELTASINMSYEKVRIDESRNTGVLVLVAPPSLPAERDARFLIVKVLASLLLAMVVGTMLAWTIELRGGRAPYGYPPTTSTEVRSEFWSALQRPWRLFRSDSIG